MALLILARVARRAQLFDSSTQALIFQCFVTFCDKQGKAWPSFKTIAHQCDCSYRTVQRAFARFVAQGYITVKRRWNTSSVYQITRKLLVDLERPVMTAAAWLRQFIGVPPSMRPAQQAARQPNFGRRWQGRSQQSSRSSRPAQSMSAQSASAPPTRKSSRGRPPLTDATPETPAYVPAPAAIRAQISDILSGYRSQVIARRMAEQSKNNNTKNV